MLISTDTCNLNVRNTPLYQPALIVTPQAYTLDVAGTWEPSLVPKQTLGLADYLAENLLKQNGNSKWKY